MRLGLPGARSDRDRAFAEYYAARGRAMRSTAYLLCGDWHLAEDLTQIAFTKLYRAWRRVERHDVLDQYVRQVLVRAFIDEKRRPWRRELVTGPEHTGPDAARPGPDVERQLVLRAALASLPPRQRAVVVLRFWDDLSIDQVADLLGMPTGTVKSYTARGLSALRQVLDPDRV